MLKKSTKITVFLVILISAFVAKSSVDMRWWPTQKPPKVILRTALSKAEPIYPESDNYIIQYAPVHMMVQSLSGLTAMAVNEGRSDEMVWTDLPDGWRHRDDYDYWYKGVVERLDLEVKGTYGPFELLEYLKNKDIYNGYILYSYDHSEGPFLGSREGIDESANAATVAAGVLKGVLISEELEDKAKQMGLKKLLDVRGKGEAWAFLTYKNHLNRKYLLAQDPVMPRQRALAIANKMMVLFEMDEPTESVYDWLEPVSSIIGYNGSHEGQFIEQLSRYGHILPASNWCLSLPILSACTQDLDPIKLKAFDLEEFEADESDIGDSVAFVMSDGDNVQWLMGDFCFNENYWASDDHGDFPIGWGLPQACLDQVCPETLEYLQKSQPDDCTLNLHAGGYYMPDVFGVRYSDEERKQLLRKHARRLDYYMKRTNTRTLQFICDDIDNQNSMEAYKIFADEVENLAGIFVLQYAPYEAGDGKVLWVRDSQGIPIPIVSCKYSLWADYPNRGGGGPLEVAEMLNKDAQQQEPLLAWTIIHAWSGFKNQDGEITSAAYESEGSHAGVTPTKWCVDRLDEEIDVVSPEKLLWLIRMKNYPEQTKNAIQKIISK